jgi:dTDP-glucose pyrophosphorylase
VTDRSSDWRKAVLHSGSDIRQAIQVLNEASMRIVLVTDQSGVLVGTISDGDIRRGFLRGLDLSSPVEAILHQDALVVPPELSREVVLQFMIANKIQQIPIVNSKKNVIGLHLWDQISAPSSRENIMVIMAGGKGTRLHPLTDNCPKPMLRITGKPILEHIIERAKIEGFSHFVLAINYLGNMIEEYFGNGHALGVNIDYLREEKPLGTAGALSLLNPRPDIAFVVTNGDVLTDIRYGEVLDFHLQHHAKATMAVRIHEWQNPFGVVKTQGIEIIGYEEKPLSRSHINAGVYVIEPEALAFLTEGSPCDMPSLFEIAHARGMRTVAYPVHEQWVDIGRPDDLSIAIADAKLREVKLNGTD